jgi:hypothetical protein
MARMQAQEFRETVAALGWSASQVAEWTGRVPSTGRRWALGEMAVPPRVATWLRRRLDALMLDPAPRLPAPRAAPSRVADQLRPAYQYYTSRSSSSGRALG